eukprot:363984-Chlamydomonas_euryale.AAC.15
MAGDGKDLSRELLDDVGARVKVAVHAVPKAKQLLLLGLDACDERGDVLHAADAAEHAQHRLVGAAVQWAIERADRAHDCSVDVHAAARKVAHRGRRAVHLMLRVQDEQDVLEKAQCE